jgi:hypothetical protein
MDNFDFDAPAEIFASRGRRASPRSMTFHRFSTGAEAIRHAMEVLPPDVLAGTVMESNEERFGAAEIRSLYESPKYPLPRVQRSRS